MRIFIHCLIHIVGIDVSAVSAMLIFHPFVLLINSLVQYCAFIMLDLMPSVLVAGWPVARASARAVFTGQMVQLLSNSI